ncbi:MAG: glutaminase [Rhodoferax sp.]|jgi:glutaminase|nr:glutaminase [Rhodoferax sp.]
MHYQSILESVAADVAPMVGGGRVANYIPALACIPIQQFGIALHTVDGQQAWAGDARTPFSIQSVSKVLGLTLALQALGNTLWERIGREPSGNAFNSLLQLENEQGKPRNPFINAGALCVADRLVSAHIQPAQAFADLGLRLHGKPFVFDDEVARSERETGFRNAALINFIKSFKQIDNDVETVLDLYCRQCAIVSDCVQLARSFSYLANAGVQPGTGETILSSEQARRVNSVMLTCGTYDAAGEFAFKVGLPCKSGVGGAIVAVVPGQMVLCAWSPGLDETGNSMAARRALELFVTRTGLSVF